MATSVNSFKGKLQKLKANILLDIDCPMNSMANTVSYFPPHWSRRKVQNSEIDLRGYLR